MPAVGKRRPLGRTLIERAHASVVDVQIERRWGQLQPLHGGADEGHGSGSAAAVAQQTRDWSWPFLMLYESARASGARSNAPHAVSNLGAMQLRLPETVLFSGGRPVKWIGTSPDGSIERRCIEPDAAATTSEDAGTLGGGDSSGGSGARGGRGLVRTPGRRSGKSNGMLSSAAMMRIIESFDEFARVNFSKLSSERSGNVLVATVWYLDGQRETMSRNRFRLVTGHTEFLKQVQAIQSFVPAKVAKTGRYEAKLHRVIRAAPLGVLEDTHDHGLNAVTAGLAQFLERVYVSEMSPIETGAVSGRGTNTSAHGVKNNDVRNPVSVSVATLTGHFTVDPFDVLWFSHCEDIQIRLVGLNREERVPKQVSSQFECARAAEQVGGELVRVIKLAEERGVSVEGSFRHFDDRGVGLVDGEALSNGLAKLGIGISDAAADLLVTQVSCDTSTMAGGSSFFRAQDLEAYVHKSRIDEHIINELEQAQKMCAVSATSGGAKIAADRTAQSTGVVGREEVISERKPNMVAVERQQPLDGPGVLNTDVDTPLSNGKSIAMREGTVTADADSSSQHSDAFIEATQKRSLWAETLQQTRHSAAAHRDLHVRDRNAKNRKCSYSEYGDEDSEPQRQEVLKNKNYGHDRHDLESVYDRDGGIVQHRDALYKERVGVLTAKLHGTFSLAISSHFAIPTLEIIGNDSLSPRTLDEREKRSLINYAETRYGQAGQFRSTKVVGLQELEMARTEDEMNSVSDPGRQGALAEWARPASKKTFAEIETTYDNWERKRNEDALKLAKSSPLGPAMVMFGSDGGRVSTNKSRDSIEMACVVCDDALLHTDEKGESPPLNPSLSASRIIPRGGGVMSNQGTVIENVDGKEAGWQKHGFSADEAQNLFKHFRQFDFDGSGDINTSELHTLMKGLGKDDNHEALGAVIKELDAVDGSGTVNFDEFLHMMDQLMHERHTVHMAEADDEDAENEVVREAAAAAQAANDMGMKQSATIRSGSTLNDRADDLFHADYGVVMSWRFITGKSNHLDRTRFSEKFNTRTVQQQREAIHQNALKLTRTDPAIYTPFLLIAAPDATSTLDTLQRHLEPLINRHPDGALLLLGLPGMPNTHWPPSMNLTAAAQGRATSKLLRHLVKTGVLDPDRYLRPDVPVFWFGVGNGAMAMFQVALTSLREERELRQLRDSTVLFAGVNAFSHVDTHLRKKTMAFQRLLLHGTYPERMAALAKLHFSGKFLMQASQLIKARAGELSMSRRFPRWTALDYTQYGRRLVLSNFWVTRRDLFLEPPAFHTVLADSQLRTSIRPNIRISKSHSHSRSSSSEESKNETQSNRCENNIDVGGKDGAQDREEDEYEESRPSGSEGLHAMLRAMTMHPDLRRDLPQLPAPLLLLTSSEDSWVLPRHSQAIEEALDWAKAENAQELVVHAAKQIELSLDSSHIANDKGISKGGMIHRQNFVAGHELLQEKHSFVLGILSDCISVANEGFHPGRLQRANKAEVLRKLGVQAPKGNPDYAVLGVSTDPADLEEYMDVLEDGSDPLAFTTELREDGSAGSDSSSEDDEARREEFEGTNKIEGAAVGAMSPSTERGVVGLTKGDTRVTSTAESDEEESSDDEKIDPNVVLTAEERAAIEKRNAEKRERRAREAALRKGRKEAQRKKRMEEERQKELRRMRVEKEAKEEKDREDRERGLMAAAEKESDAYATYLEELDAWYEGCEGARKRAVELQAAREEDEARELEYEAARARSRKHEERVRHLREEQALVEKEELAAGSGGQVGGYAFMTPEGKLDIEMCGIGCSRLVNDLFNARQKLVNAFKRQRTTEAKYMSFRDQFDRGSNEVRVLRRTLRLVESNRAMGDTSVGEEEIDEMKTQQSKKEYELSELESLLTARKTMLATANRICQGLKLVVKEREEACVVAISQVQEAILDIADRVGKLRLKTEKEGLERKQRIDLLRQMLERKAIVGAELKRVAQHPGKMINCAVWNAGVMQRMETTHLYRHLTNEYRTLRAVCTDLEQLIKESQDRIVRFNARMNILNSQSMHIGKLKEEVDRCYGKAAKRSIIEELEQQDKLEQEAEERRIQELQEKEEEEKSKQRSAPIEDGGDGAHGGANNAGRRSDTSDMLAIITRDKKSALRTNEEKSWVALDMLLNREYYDKIDDVEKEEMKYDEGYQVWQATGNLVKMEDVNRILALPMSAAAAMPFLKDKQQIEIHRLLVKFTYGRGEAFQKGQDSRSQDEKPQVETDGDSDDGGGGGSSDDDDSADDRCNRPLGGKRRCKAKAEGGSSRDYAKRKVSADELHEAKEHVMVFLRAKHCDRIRATPFDEQTEEERMWSVLDKILHPDQYLVEENCVQKDIEADDFVPPPQPKPVPPGDVYEEQRLQYELGIAPQNLNPPLEPGWVCPHDEMGLLTLINTPESMVQNDEDIKIRYLLEKYYVPPELSHMGRQRRSAIAQLEIETRVLAESARLSEEMHERQLMSKDGGEVTAVPWFDPDTGVIDEGRLSETASRLGITREDVGSAAGTSKAEARAKALHDASTSPNQNTSIHATKQKLQDQSHNNISALRDKAKRETGEEEAEKSEDVRRQTWNRHRIWGSWEVVHPASLGKTSQSENFPWGNFYLYQGGASVHPASFSLPDTAETLKDSLSEGQLFYNKSEVGGKVSCVAPFASRDYNGALKDSKKQLRSRKREQRDEARVAKKAEKDKKKASSRTVYKVVPSLKALGSEMSELPLLVPAGRDIVLLEENDLVLETRQSRTHSFEIGYDDGGIDDGTGTYRPKPLKPGQHILDVTVSISFRGVFGVRGYRSGRLSAILMRLPPMDNATAQPVQVGYAPYKLQSLNTSETEGKVTIIHSPKAVPLYHRGFQLVVGAVSASQYSVSITGRLAEDADVSVERHLKYAKETQGQLPKLGEELEDLWTSMRLFERKLLVVQEMMLESEAESQRCEHDIEMCNEELIADDETGDLRDDERVDIFNEIRALEVEFAHWCRLYAIRAQEKHDTRRNLQRLSAARRELLVRKEKILEELGELRGSVPAAVGTVQGIEAATIAALDLNTTFTPNAAHNKWTRLNSLKTSMAARTITPAGEVRRRYKAQGFAALSLEEKQWTMLDKAMNPDKYSWVEIEEAKEEERFQMECQIAMDKGLDKPKRKKKKKLNRAVRQFQFSREEINRILESPFKTLNRREAAVQKLVKKFHDNPELLKKKATQMGADFDPNRAQRTRIKHFLDCNDEEKDWIKIDKIVNEGAWKTIQGRNEHAHGEEEEPPEMDDKQGFFPPFPLEPELLREVEEERLRKEATDKRKHRADRATASRLRTKVRSLLKMGNAAAAQVAEVAAAATEVQDWKCPFNKGQLLEIWSHPMSKLRGHDAKKARRLLHKYNGDYSDYAQWQAAKALREAIQQELNKSHAGIPHSVNFDTPGGTVTQDVDKRCREVQKEMDRAANNSNLTMDSFVLHGHNQRFPTTVLRMELEQELDDLLRAQVHERERVQLFLVEEDSEDEISEESAFDEGNGTSDGNRGRRDAENSESDGSSDSSDTMDSKFKERIRLRKEGRKLRRQRKAQDKKLKDQVSKVKQLVGEQFGLDEAQKEAAREFDALGFGACYACNANPCQWHPTCDVPKLKERRGELGDEIHFVRMHPDVEKFESVVPLSAKRGGSRRFRRTDLMHELTFEDTLLERQVRLCGLDKELHDSWATKKDHIEVRVLHGYRTLMWVSNARTALNFEHNKLVAATFATELVDDILEFMLEGWVFGEVKSKFKMAGFVPSVKSEGKVMALLRPSQAINTMVEDTDNNGIPDDALEDSPKWQLSDRKAILVGDERDIDLKTTEMNIRFGIFTLTLMYFRAMSLLRKEKKSWNGGGADGHENTHEEEGSELEEGAEVAGKARGVTGAERMRQQADARALDARLSKDMGRATTGEQRKRIREDGERKAAAANLYAKVKLENHEKDAAQDLQRIYRGHLGRKAGRRWGMKRAELWAMNALMNASAITMQRIYRGFMGKRKASDVRGEMAEFIAMIRIEEAMNDEEEFWRTHTLSRIKRDLKEMLTFRKNPGERNPYLHGDSDSDDD